MYDNRYWHERIGEDLVSTQRKLFLAERDRADELITNELNLGITNNTWAFKRSTWMKTFQHVGGRMFYGEMHAKVDGVELEDEEIAEIYEAGINWEFNQPRGIHQKTGRSQIRRVGEDWLNYGMGVLNTYFDPRQRSRENPTGSIINEAVFGDELILDSRGRHFEDVMHVGRVIEKTVHQVAAMYPFLDPEIIPHNDQGMSYLFEVQFRSPTLVTGKLASRELQEITKDYRPVYPDSDKELIKGLFRKGKKGAKNSDSDKAWDGLKSDAYEQPIVYSTMFLCNHNTYDKNNNPVYLTVYEPRIVGADFSYTIIPFLFQPKRVYPAGAAKFIYDDQVYEALLMTLYMEMLKYLNNTGVAINLDNIIGTNESEKLNEVKRFLSEPGYPLLLKHVQDINTIISQFKQNSPPRDMLYAAEQARWSGEDFFQTHPGQTGSTPPSGTPFRSMALAQQQGQNIMAHMVDSMQTGMTKIFRKNAHLIYKYIPDDKSVRLTSSTGERKNIMLVKKKIETRDPQDLDIYVSIDTETEIQKQQKEQKAMVLFQSGLSAPEDFLKDLGYKNIEDRLNRVQRYQRGQLIVAMEERNPGLKGAIDEAIAEDLIENGQK